MLQSILANSIWLPRGASTVAPSTDRMFNIIMGLCVFFFALIVVLMVLFVIKYRHRPGVKRDTAACHSMTLEITWTVIPSIMVVFLYYYGFKQYLNLAIEPPNSYEIVATGKMWQWSFTYPNGYVDPQLHVPVNTPVRLVLQSDDVIHSLSIPAFRVKKDVVPGRYNRLWFQATEPSSDGYDIFCAAYCGTNHSFMHSKVIVHASQADFDAWLAGAAARANNLSPVELGKKLYVQQGCAQCHSIDGSRIVGPSWKDLFGSTQEMNDGSKVVVDEQFVHGFLPNPTLKYPVGYQPVMPPFQLKDRDVNAIVAFLKSISKHYHEGTSPQTGAATQPHGASAPAPAVAR